MGEETKIKKLFKEQLTQTRKSIIIISAFITDYGFNFVKNNLDDSVKEKIVILRGQLEDFKQGVTKFNFKKAINDGWQVYINLDLHAKIYVFDQEKLIAGSSNLTWGGLVNNQERNSLNSYTKTDQKEVQDIVNTSTLVNDIDIARVEEILGKINKVDEYSFYELQKEWKSIFYDPQLTKEMELGAASLSSKEKYFLNKQAAIIKKRLLDFSDTFIEKIEQDKIDYKLPNKYIINLKKAEINYLPFHFDNKKYKYLLRFYQIGSTYYREKVNLPSLADIWYNISEHKKNLLLNNLIQAINELYTQSVMVNINYDQIYYYEYNLPKLKFAEYTYLNKGIPVKEVVASYQKKLSEYFGRKKLIDELELGG